MMEERSIRAEMLLGHAAMEKLKHVESVLLNERNGVARREARAEAVNCRLANFLRKIAKERVENELLGAWHGRISEASTGVW